MIPPGAQAPCPAGARDDEATRLRRFVASVPNRISIGAARGAAPLSALLGLLLLGGAWTLRDHPGPGHEAAALCLLAAAALLMCLACLQRNARNAPFLVLGQGRLRARSLSAPLDLLEVADLRLEDGVWFSAIVLELHGKALPAPSTRPLDPFAARAVSECRDGPRVRLLSPAGASTVATCRYWKPRRSSTSTWTSPAPRPGSANWARSRPVLPLHSQLQGYFHEQPGTPGPRLQPRRNPRCRTRRAEPGEDRRGHRPPGAGDRQRTAGHRVHQYPQVRGAGSAAEHRALHHDRHVVLPGQAGVGVVGLLLGLFGLFLGYQHRNSGKTPFMRLTRTQLWADSLSAPVELADVIDFSVKADMLQTTQTLHLRPETPLPTHRAVRQVFASQAMAFKGKDPRITIMSAGLQSDGRSWTATTWRRSSTPTSRPPTPSATCNNCAARAE